MNLGRIGRSLLGGTLATAVFAATLRASEAPAPAPKAASVNETPGGRGAGLLPPLPYAPARVRSARTIGGTSAQRVGDADEEKQRVPKQPDESRRKPEPGVAPQATESTDESSCVGSCIGSFFEGLFSSNSAPSPPPPPSIAPTGMAWLPGARGEIHSDMPVPIWDGAGGPGAGRNHVGVLPPRTRVTVLESNASIEGLWLRVQPTSADGPVGWMDSGYLGPFTEPEAPPDTAALPPERFSVWLAVGGALIGPSDLNLEYTEGGFRAEGQFLWGLAGAWQLGAGVGYRHFQGTPQVLYTTPSVIEEPTNSTLQLVDVGLRGGQRFGARSRGPRFTWLLGAGTVLVDEKADVVVSSSSTGLEIDRREDSLSRWRFGGDLRLAVAWPVGSNFDIGLLLGGWMVDWQGEKKLSLTTDFLTEPIYGFDAALCFTFGGR